MSFSSGEPQYLLFVDLWFSSGKSLDIVIAMGLSFSKSMMLTHFV